jgi:hypothetical protein
MMRSFACLIILLAVSISVVTGHQSSLSAHGARLPELVRSGQWDEAQKTVDALLAADPGNLDAMRWQSDIQLVDSRPALYVANNAIINGTFWLRSKWVGFTAEPVSNSFCLPLGNLELKFKEHTSWNQPGFGTVTYGIDIESGKEKHRIVTRDSFYETLSLHHRIRSMQVKSFQPFKPPADIRREIKNKEATQLKGLLEELIRSGRWNDAQIALQHLADLQPDDPDLPRFKDEMLIVKSWNVRTWSPSDGYAGKLVLRKNWITFEGEDFGSDRNKPLRNESFHFPLTALRKIDTCSEKNYGAKLGSGGLLDAVPGWATDVTTGKNFGFEFQFDAGGGKNVKSELILRPEEPSKDAVKNQIEEIRAIVDALPGKKN